ncbi:PilZ domain-containing protein [Hahella sp. SMD15-11]|uniref:PilZ domain-containing protein n=1 Tax=Thermohahella caldifontis TaxID=3142973 RepID=A0AB39UXP1_9GAMM
MTKSKPNRRKFYRIETRALLRVLPQDKDPETSPVNMGEEAWPALQRNLAALDGEFSHLAALLYDRDKTMLAALKVINRKIDLLARTLTATQTTFSETDIHTINLSEGGLSYLSDAGLPVRQPVQIHLVLLPDYIGFRLRGFVLHADPEGSRWRIHLQFGNLAENDRKLLAKLVLQHQQHTRQNRDNSIN